MGRKYAIRQLYYLTCLPTTAHRKSYIPISTYPARACMRGRGGRLTWGRGSAVACLLCLPASVTCPYSLPLATLPYGTFYTLGGTFYHSQGGPATTGWYLSLVFSVECSCSPGNPGSVRRITPSFPDGKEGKPALTLQLLPAPFLLPGAF